MNEVNPTFGVNLGPEGLLQWPVARAVLWVQLIPGGGLNQAAWHLNAPGPGPGLPTFACLFALFRNGTLTYPAEGQQVAAALRQLPGFDEAVFAEAQQAVVNATAGQFVCWERPVAPEES